MHEEWLAMGIDTDGWISIDSYQQITIGFSNTSEQLTTAFTTRAEALNCRTHESHATLDSGKIFFTVYIRGTREEPGHEDKLRFLEAIYPHLLGHNKAGESKKELAKQAIELLKIKLSTYQRLLQRKRELNPLNFMESNKWYSTDEVMMLMSKSYYDLCRRLNTLVRKGLVEKKFTGRKAYWKVMDVEHDEVELTSVKGWEKFG